MSGGVTMPVTAALPPATPSAPTTRTRTGTRTGPRARRTGRSAGRRRDGDEDGDFDGFSRRVGGDHGELVDLGFIGLRADRTLSGGSRCRGRTGRQSPWTDRDLSTDPVDSETGRSLVRVVQGVGEWVTRVLGPHRCTDATPRPRGGSDGEGGRGLGKCRGIVGGRLRPHRMGRDDLGALGLGRVGHVSVRHCDAQVRAHIVSLGRIAGGGRPLDGLPRPPVLRPLPDPVGGDEAVGIVQEGGQLGIDLRLHRRQGQAARFIFVGHSDGHEQRRIFQKPIGGCHGHGVARLGLVVGRSEEAQNPTSDGEGVGVGSLQRPLNGVALRVGGAVGGNRSRVVLLVCDIGIGRPGDFRCLVHVGDANGDGLPRGMTSGGGFHGHAVAIICLVVGRIVESEDAAAEGEGGAVGPRQRPSDKFLFRVVSAEGSDYPGAILLVRDIARSRQCEPLILIFDGDGHRDVVGGAGGVGGGHGDGVARRVLMVQRRFGP